MINNKSASSSYNFTIITAQTSQQADEERFILKLHIKLHFLCHLFE